MCSCEQIAILCTRIELKGSIPVLTYIKIYASLPDFPMKLEHCLKLSQMKNVDTCICVCARVRVCRGVYSTAESIIEFIHMWL